MFFALAILEGSFKEHQADSPSGDYDCYHTGSNLGTKATKGSWDGCSSRTTVLVAGLSKCSAGTDDLAVWQSQLDKPFPQRVVFNKKILGNWYKLLAVFIGYIMMPLIEADIFDSPCHFSSATGIFFWKGPSEIQ